MAFSSGSDTTRRTAKGNPLDLDVNDWAQPEKEPRDLKKLALVIGLGLLSWVATYVGMLELIEANMGDLPLVHKLIIGFSVAMLMTMVIWLLDQMFSPINTFTKAVLRRRLPVPHRHLGRLRLRLLLEGAGKPSEASRSAERRRRLRSGIAVCRLDAAGAAPGDPRSAHQRLDREGRMRSATRQVLPQSEAR